MSIPSRSMLRREFVSAVSHDLRTPLTAARASLGLLETSAAERLRSEERGLLQNGRRNMERLGMLIDDLLTINQIEAGTLHLEHTLVDLRGIVGRAIGVVHPLIREKGQVLEIDIPDPLPVTGDGRRLEHVLVNVLANAHEHTPEGTRISISARTTPGQITLSIADDGPGIPAGELEAVFQRFHSLDPARGGSGLGLVIARSVVEMHGGRIWAESGRGKGATFHIALVPAEEVGGV
jgi:signal transduction histidine kinase